MRKVYIGEIKFKGKKSFDTVEKAKEFAESLGERYQRIYRCDYPDVTFYIVEFKED